MEADIRNVMAFLQTSPLFWLALTVLIYMSGQGLQRRMKGAAVVNPVAVTVLVLGMVLSLTHTPYHVYFEGAHFIHFLLGPATVALAVPLYDHFPKVKRVIVPLLVSLIVGSVTGVLSAAGLAWALGGSLQTILSLAPKSATSPIAMGISEKIGGIPSLTAGLVILTGIIGAIAAPFVLKSLGLKDNAAAGFGIGLGAHGIGTARAFQINEVMGLFAGIGMALNGMMTAIVTPFLLSLF